MTKNAKRATARAKWEQPVLTAIDMDMSNVEAGFLAGSDGLMAPTGNSMS